MPVRDVRSNRPHWVGTQCDSGEEGSHLFSLPTKSSPPARFIEPGFVRASKGMLVFACAFFGCPLFAGVAHAQSTEEPSVPAAKLAPIEVPSAKEPAEFTDQRGIADPDASPMKVTVQAHRPVVGAAPKDRYVAGWVASGPRLRVAGIQAAEVLRDSPGVQITQTGGLGAPATASLRGATAAQTPVYLAGIRLNDEVGGAANLADVPLFLIDRVEVYRSHAPLVADRMGIGGAIFFEPKRPTGQVLGMGAMSGSFGSRAGWAYVGAGDEQGAVLAGIEASAADNDYAFDDDRGTLYRGDDDHRGRLRNADVEGQSVWLTARRSVGPSWISLIANHGIREQGAPKLATVPSREARIGFERNLVGLRAVTPLDGDDAFCGTVEGRTAVVTSRTTIEDPLAELGLLSSLTRTPGVRVEQLLAVRQAIGALSLVEQATVSVERLQRYRRSNGRSELELSARRSMTRASFGAVYGLTERLFVEGNGAIECFATSTGSLAFCDSVAPTGRLGASFRAERYEIYSSVGEYHRLPTLSELYGASLLVRGNDTLHAESGLSGEVGGRWHWLGAGGHRLMWTDASVFGRNTRELVTFVRTAQGFMHPVNRDSARTVGAETVLGASPLRWLEGEATLSLLDSRDTSSDRETVNDVLPFASQLVGGARLSFLLELRRSAIDRVGLTLRGLHQSSRYVDPAGLGVVPSQNTLDVEFDMTFLDEQIRAALRLANILDAERFDVVGFPLPGRSGFLSLEAKL